MVLGQKDAANWVYRGEGAANIVLAYTGSYPAFVGKVLRVQKAPRNGSNSVNGSEVLTAHECLVWKDFKELVSSASLEIAGQLYVQHVMIPLLGSGHVDAGLRVLVSREFLESVENNVLSQRPASRVKTTKVNVLCDSALLISDHSVFPNGTVKDCLSVSVEIKPKCGFLPFSRIISEKNAVKRTVTRFRMHQFLKLHQQEISEISEYDPLDLFSGSKDKIHRATEALLSTPQNNFRVFVNGCLVFGGLGGGANSTNSMTAKAFEDVLECVIRTRDGLRTKSFLQLVSETIFKSKVLDKLLEVQKLDIFDIEGAIHAYYNILSQPCFVCKHLDGEHKYASLHQMSLDESLKIVRDYLIAASAKDCSLMISFRPRAEWDPESPNGNIYLESTKQSFDYKANFIDLDMKPLEKMEYYYELDQKILSCYNQMMKPVCEPDRVSGVDTYNSFN